MKTVNKAYVVIAVGALGALYGWAQEPRPSRMTIPFSDPARPKALQVRIIQGTIHVQGYEGNDVLVEGLSEAGRKNPPPPQIDGLPRVDWGGTDLGAVESNNVVTVAERGAPRPTQLSIQVPVAAAVKLHAVNAEEVTVDRVSGDVEVNLTHGAVTATHISGSAAVHVVDGKIKVVLDRVAGDKPVSLSSLHGDIDLTLPADAKVSLKMKSHDG